MSVRTGKPLTRMLKVNKADYPQELKMPPFTAVTINLPIGQPNFVENTDREILGK